MADTFCFIAEKRAEFSNACQMGIKLSTTGKEPKGFVALTVPLFWAPACP
jgi:hypothetical protein